MKKVGNFLLTVAPLVVFMAIMSVVQIIAVVVYALIMLTTGNVGNDVMGLFLDLTGNVNVLMAITAVSQIVTFVCFVIFYKKVMLKNKEMDPVSAVFDIKSFLSVVFGFFGVEMVVSTCLIFLSAIAPETMEEYANFIESSGLGENTFFSVLAAVVCAPIVEELVFRGVTFKLARKFTGSFIIANCIQAFMFGLAHITSANLVQPIYALCLGLSLGFIYKKFNSLYATILAQLSFNLMGTVGVGLVFADEDPSGIYICTVALVAVAIIVIATINIVKSEKCKQREAMFIAESNALAPVKAVAVDESFLEEKNEETENKETDF